MGDCRILVTGGAGFIGRSIIKACNRKGWMTTSLDLESSINASKSIVGSIMDWETVIGATSEVDLIFHEAAVTSPPQFETDGVKSFNTNVAGTLNVLQAAYKNDVEKVVLASSSSVYGDISVPGREDMEKPVYGNLYPLSKSVNEQTASYFSARGDVETVCLRYFNTFGVGENTKGAYSSIISKFIDDLEASRTPTIFGDGTQRRDFIYIDDVAEANILAAEKGKSGEAYNVGTGETTTFNRIYEIIREEYGSGVEPDYRPIPYKSYQMFTHADMTKSEKELGFKPKNDIRSGVRKMLDNRG